jgi:hypothetical protein
LWYETVATSGGFAEDEKTRQEQLLDGYFAIPLESEIPVSADEEGGLETPALTKFFKDRDAYRASLSEEDQRLLDAGLDSFRTEKETEFYQDLREMEPYWDAGLDRFINEQITKYGREEDIREYFESSGVSQDSLKDSTTNPDGYRFYLRLQKNWATSRSSGTIKHARDQAIRMYPQIERLLIKWRYKSEPLDILPELSEDNYALMVQM